MMIPIAHISLALVNSRELWAINLWCSVTSCTPKAIHPCGVSIGHSKSANLTCSHPDMAIKLINVGFVKMYVTYQDGWGLHTQESLMALYPDE